MSNTVGKSPPWLQAVKRITYCYFSVLCHQPLNHADWESANIVSNKFPPWRRRYEELFV